MWLSEFCQEAIDKRKTFNMIWKLWAPSKWFTLWLHAVNRILLNDSSQISSLFQNIYELLLTCIQTFSLLLCKFISFQKMNKSILPSPKNEGVVSLINACRNEILVRNSSNLYCSSQLTRTVLYLLHLASPASRNKYLYSLKAVSISLSRLPVGHPHQQS